MAEAYGDPRGIRTHGGGAGALYGAVYDAYGFFAVSFAATATLWIEALAVQTLLDRKKT